MGGGGEEKAGEREWEAVSLRVDGLCFMAVYGGSRVVVYS